MTPAEIRTIRERTGLSQPRFCASYRIPLTSLRAWEQGLRQPGAAAEALLLAIGRDHETMRELLA